MRFTARSCSSSATKNTLRRAGTSKYALPSGSTGTVPSTARLLKVIASLPNGAVVLPGQPAHAEIAAAWPDVIRHCLLLLLLFSLFSTSFLLMDLSPSLPPSSSPSPGAGGYCHCERLQEHRGGQSAGPAGED